MNPTLTKIISEITAKVPQNEMLMFQKWVAAGTKIMFDPQSHQHMQLVSNPEARNNPVQTIAAGVTGLVWIMYGQAGKPKLDNDTVQVMGFSAIALMCHAIDFAERSLKIEFTPDMIADCTKWLVQHLFERAGIGQQQLQEAINAHGQQAEAAAGQQPSAQQAQPQQGGLLAGGQ